MNKKIMITIWLLFVMTLCKEVALSSKQSKEDKTNGVENQCCSSSNPDCCVSLTYSKSTAKNKDVPKEFGGTYYCEYMDITKTGTCGNLDYILLPVSKSCDFTRVLWDLRWESQDMDANGFTKAQILANEEIVLNNGDEFLLTPDDQNNPTGYHALKFPIESEPWNKPKRTISVCTQLGAGDIINNITGKEIEIGFSIDNGNDMFACSNETIRDLCSIDTSLATYNAENQPLNVIHLNAKNQGINSDNDPHFNNFYNTFEYYWNQYVGFGIAVFAASIFFNIVMCIYWSGYKASDYYTNTQEKIVKIIIDTDDGDDQTEEESDDTDF